MGHRLRSGIVIVVAAAAVLAGSATLARADTVTFTNGIDLWLSSSNSADTGNANLGWGRSTGTNARNYDSLIQFTDMFGADAGQIPLGSTIEEATLYMWIGYDSGDTSYIYQMTYGWNANSTWNSIGSTGGIVAGVNTEATPELTWTGTSDAWSQRQFDLTASVQDWSGGADAFGWGFTKSRLGTASATSLDYGTDSYRPFLTVDFTPPATVPLPAALPLGLVGLAAVAVVRRRRP